MLHWELTEQVICAFYRVYNTLGHGFLEKVYENALGMELRKTGLAVEQQQPIKVYYEGEVAGEYFADIVVANLVVVELKAAEALRGEHLAQVTNYLKATKKEVGLLFNFGSKPEFKRVVLCNSTKPF